MTDLPLNNIPLFGVLSSEELVAFGQSFRVKVLKAQEVLFNEGDKGDCFFIVTTGELEVIKALGTPEERQLGVMVSGDFVGEMSILGRNNLRSASVRAVGEAYLLELRRESFEEIIKAHPGAALRIIQEMSDRLRTNDESTITDLRQKNQELAQAYHDLKEAQAALIEQEKLKHELDMARQIQMSILPQDVPVPDGCEIGAKMVPARAVGGDFYDIIPLGDGKVGIAIGDVSDKGIPAALFMAQFCTLLRAVAQQTEDQTKVLTAVNNLLLDANTAGMFVTAIYGVYDSKQQTFTYSRGGHEVPVIFNQAGEIMQSEHGQGTALCVFPDPLIDHQTVHLPPGSTLLMYTDGGTDAMNAQEAFFGLDNLKSIISSRLNAPTQELCEEVVTILLDYQKESQFDDVTLVALRTLAD